jgi:hypothetical protein
MIKVLFNISKKINSQIWFVALILALFYLNQYNKTIFFRPSSIHQWRQADCLSITKNYYEENLNFFQPKIHYQGVKNGNAVSEFPILNYTVAKFWQIFGEHEFIYRIIEYILFITAMYMLLVALYKQFQSALIAFFVVGFVMSSPLIVYYSLNFIVDVPAFSLSLMAFCFSYLFYKKKKLYFFYLALIIGTLAVLMKASALVGLVVLLFFAIVDILNFNTYFKTERLFQKKVLPIISILVSLFIIYAWYTYALYYNNYHKNEVFLLTILPIWELNSEELAHAIKMLFNSFLLPWFLNKPMFFLFISVTGFVIVKIKQVDVFLKYAFILSGLYFILFFIFFFQVFNLHDYYLINLMIFPIVSLWCFADLIVSLKYFSLDTKYFKLFVVLVLTFNFFNSAAMYRLRTINNDNLVHWYPFISEEEENLAKYLFWDYSNAIQRVENITPVLRKNGIKREDLVLSIPDPSFNISLYFMDQKGYTITRDHLLNDTLVTDHFLNKGIKYVIVSDTTLINEIAFKRLNKHLQPFFTEKNVKILKFN